MDLDEVINSIDDVTDPSSMETILMYLDYIETLDEEFIELLMQKLPYMDITWEQPWYQQCNSLTRPVTVTDENKDTFLTGKMTVLETRLINKNWRKFRKNFDVPDHPECIARWKNKKKSRNPQTPEECIRRFVIAYLARGLKRTLYQVYKHVLTYYGSPIKGKYSLQEEKLMEVCFFHNASNAIPILSKVLGRESRGIYKKFHEWSEGTLVSKRITWKLPLATKLLNLIMQYTGCKLDDLRYNRLDKSVWLKLQDDMQHPYMYLQRFWWSKLHVQIFVKKNVKINKLRRRIARKLEQSSYQKWRDIRWKEMAKEFPDGFTNLFLYKVWANIFKNNKHYLTFSIKELIEYALNRMRTLPNRRLKTLTLNSDGELQEIRYKEKL